MFVIGGSDDRPINKKMYIRGPGRTFSDNRVSLALKVGPEEPDIGNPQPGKESTTSKKQCWYSRVD